MRDSDVRLALLAALDDQHRGDPATRVVPELDLCGRGRVDVAVVNGRLCGYEIKSAADTLKRLPLQIESYSAVLDEVTLVVAERHAEAAEAQLPTWWGITIALETDQGVRLQDTRACLQNPDVVKHALVQLLWRDEVLQELAVLGLATGLRSKPRATLWTCLADALETDRLQEIVRHRLKQRVGWRVDQ